MLAKTFRLDRLRVQQVILNGQLRQSSCLSVRFLANELGNCRYAVVTSTKLSKLAVVRNRLRRVIYNSQVQHTGACDIVLFPKAAMLNLTDAQISIEVNSLLSTLPGLSQRAASLSV